MKASSLLSPEAREFIEVAGSDEERVSYGFYHENRHFIDCIKVGIQPETNFADAAKSMKLVDDLYASVI